jgi:hypothetical protein
MEAAVACPIGFFPEDAGDACFFAGVDFLFVTTSILIFLAQSSRKA